MRKEKGKPPILHQPLSTLEFLRQEVFARDETEHDEPIFRNDMPMSTLDYITYDVFRNTPIPERLHGHMISPPPLGSASSEVGGFGGKAPQTGPEGPRDFTPNNAPRMESRQFVTLQGERFGSMSFVRDVLGRIVRRSITLWGETTSHEYTYDSDGRLVAVVINGVESERYAYGLHGERIQDGQGNRYEYDGSLRLVGIHGPNGGTKFLYDAEGRMVEKADSGGATLYGYNERGALVDVVFPNEVHIHYVMDSAGRRAAKYVNGEVVEKYSWLDMARLRSVSDGRGGNGKLFLYPEDFGRPEGWLPVAMQRGGEVCSLAFDQAGALLAVAGNNVNEIQQSRYQSFGSEIAMRGAGLALPISFGGGLLDRDTGLIHYVYRDYDPDTAHFIQPDPLGYAAGDIEVYGFCLDDPVNLVDPWGLEAKKPATGGDGNTGQQAQGKAGGDQQQAANGGDVQQQGAQGAQSVGATDQQNSQMPAEGEAIGMDVIDPAKLEQAKKDAKQYKLDHLSVEEKQRRYMASMGVYEHQGVYYSKNGKPLGEKGLESPAVDPIDVAIPGVGMAAKAVAKAGAKAAGTAAKKGAPVLAKAAKKGQKALEWGVKDLSKNPSKNLPGFIERNRSVMKNGYDAWDGAFGPTMPDVTSRWARRGWIGKQAWDLSQE